MMGPIKPFTTVDRVPFDDMLPLFVHPELYPLSGYLAGRKRGGYYVCQLEDLWCERFHVKHAIAVNSATSGLLAAAVAIDLGPGKKFACPAMTMSATAAAPAFTGAEPIFADVYSDTFSIELDSLPYDTPVFATNLFGMPAHLHRLRSWCDLNKVALIEDNSQSPFAMEKGRWAGTIGHIGVWSLNIHKPIQCGEGGMVTTDDDGLAEKIRSFINHGENGGHRIGLNLRMPELCAAVALSQLRRGPEIVKSRIDQAEAICAAIGNIDGLSPPLKRHDAVNVFYTIPFCIIQHREDFCRTLEAKGVPIVRGYVPPLHTLKAFAAYRRDTPTATWLHDRSLFYIENCAYDFTDSQIRLIGDAFKQAADLVLARNP